MNTIIGKYLLINGIIGKKNTGILSSNIDGGNVNSNQNFNIDGGDPFSIYNNNLQINGGNP